ncbi:HAD hydrolase-like protein [Anaerolineales bacterium HSG25]|nr:HAD hydrolase-like protein [Anaerolineales bacterium HSG25]
MFDIIAFDADDTLWHNEGLYISIQEQLKTMLTNYCSAELVDEKLYQTEIKNLSIWGYGIKGFVLSMIETALELSDEAVSGAEIQTILDMGMSMIAHPIDLLPGVEKTLQALQPDYPLMVITKGDLFEQESKIARSGLANYFQHVEIVSHKTESSYRAVLQKYNLNPKRFLMIGNSVKSDILPILQIGGQAVHIPYTSTWAHEQVEILPRHDFATLAQIADLPRWLRAA